MVSDSGVAILVKGTSGSGKSTRVYCFLSFLESIGMKFQPFVFKNIEGVEKEMGIYLEDLNLVVLGKFYEKGGVRRWQGYDAVTGRICRSEGLSYFLKEMGQKKVNVLVEGAGVTVTWRLRPMELCSEYEYLNILYKSYNYTIDQKDEYLRRIAYRSGKPPKGDQMWSKRNGFENDYKQSIVDAEALRECGADIVIKMESYDAPVWDLGWSIFEYFGLNELCEEYKKFVEDSEYIEQNSYEYMTANEE